jgi:uncharacterized damage-inducible protein DinB
MITPDYVRTMASYNSWMNQRIYDACKKLPDAERKRDKGAFFKSIHGTLNHLLLADRVWMGRFTGRPFAITSLDQELYADFAQLRSEREEQDRIIRVWADDLTADQLGSELAFTSIVSPQPRRYPFAFAVMHFFNHQAHHRGQVTTLLSQNIIDPGVTDLLMLPEFQPSKPSALGHSENRHE